MRNDGIVEALTQTQGNDVHIRNMLDIDARFHQEADSVLRQLYSYWHQLPRKDGLPVAPAVDFSHSTFEKFEGGAGWIDVSSEDPLNFKIPLRPSFTDFADIENKPIKEHPSSMNALALAREHFYCKLSRSPVYYEIDQTINGSTRHYFRLALPLVDWDGEVTKLLYGVRMFAMRPRTSVTPVRSNDNGAANSNMMFDQSDMEIRSFYLR